MERVNSEIAYHEEWQQREAALKAFMEAADALRKVSADAHNRLQELDELSLRTEVREAIIAYDAAREKLK